MRITTANAFDTGVDTLQRRQGELTDAQEQLTTGKRVNRASDDPAAAARAERALASVEPHRREPARRRRQQGRDDADRKRARRRRRPAAAGARAAGRRPATRSYSDAERKSIADELQSLRDQLFAVANRSDGAGTYLFGGQGATQPPFVDAPAACSTSRPPARRCSRAATGLPLTIDGSAAWLQARTGNGVFVTSAAPSAGTASIDSGSVTDPSALTGADYSVQFSVGGGVTTYSVLKNGAADRGDRRRPTSRARRSQIDGMTRHA